MTFKVKSGGAKFCKSIITAYLMEISTSDRKADIEKE